MSDPRPHEQADTPEAALVAERQRRVEALADEYLEGLLAGRTPDRPAFLAAHPDLADLLEPRLALVELMHRVAGARARLMARRRAWRRLAARPSASSASSVRTAATASRSSSRRPPK